MNSTQHNSILKLTQNSDESKALELTPDFATIAALLCSELKDV